MERLRSFVDGGATYSWPTCFRKSLEDLPPLSDMAS